MAMRPKASGPLRLFEDENRFIARLPRMPALSSAPVSTSADSTFNMEIWKAAAQIY
jgi:hypothetical protein